MLAPINARQLLMRHLKSGGVGAEIGVHTGDFSANLVNTAKPSKLYLIDPWEHFETPEHQKSMYGGAASSPEIMEKRYEGVRARFKPQIDAGNIRIVRKRSAEGAADFPADFFDYVYIDGDHNKAGVTADIEAYWPKLKPGGIMAFDDYSLTGWWGDGVVASVHELLAKRPSLLLLAMDNQIAIRKTK
jgi:hypothetical protein